MLDVCTESVDTTGPGPVIENEIIILCGESDSSHGSDNSSPPGSVTDETVQEESLV